MAVKKVSKRQVSRRQMRTTLPTFEFEFSTKSTHGNLHSVTWLPWVWTGVSLVWKWMKAPVIEGPFRSVAFPRPLI